MQWRFHARHTLFRNEVAGENVDDTGTPLKRCVDSVSIAFCLFFGQSFFGHLVAFFRYRRRRSARYLEEGGARRPIDDSLRSTATAQRQRVLAAHSSGRRAIVQLKPSARHMTLAIRKGTHSNKGSSARFDPAMPEAANTIRP